MKVLFSCGGTGGHINPAIAIANTMKAKYPDFEALFVGTRKGIESTLVTKAGYNIEYVKVRGFKRKLSLSNIDAAWKAITSVYAAKRIIKRFKPDVVIGTGGYASWAAVKAGSKLKIPTVIHEQNAFPGVTTRKLSKLASTVCISFEESRRFFAEGVQNKLVLTGNPLKPELKNADREAARKTLGLTDEVYIVSFGGSLGAEKINEYVFETLADYVAGNPKIKHIHATGKNGYEKYKALAEQKGIAKASNIEISEYIYDMDKQLAAADLVICRAGAITIAENCCLGKASILIPSPNVTADHQYKNAKVLSDAGAALLIKESDCNGKVLTDAVQSLVENPDKRKEMAAAARGFAKVNAAEEIASLAYKAGKAKVK